MTCAALNDKERSTEMINFLSGQLTTTNNLRPYHYEPTILPLRTYDLTIILPLRTYDLITNPRRNKGALKEH